MGHLVPQLLRARFHQLLRNVHGGAGHRRVERRLTELGLDLLLLALGQALPYVGAQLLERVEAGLDRQVVVERRKLLLLDLLHRDRELGLAALEVVGAVIVGKGDGDRALLAGLRARELLLEARDQASRAELDHLVAPLAAGERLAVQRADVVRHHEVAALGGPLDRLELRRAVPELLDLGVDRLVGGLGLAPPDLELLVLPERGLGAHADLDREAQRLALARPVGDVEVRLSDGNDLGRTDGGRVPHGDRVTHGLVEHGLAPDALDDHRRRDLAGPEARDPHAAAELTRRLVDALLDLRGRHLGLDADARLRQLGDGGGDVGSHGRTVTIQTPHAAAICGVARVWPAGPPVGGRARLGRALRALAPGAASRRSFKFGTVVATTWAAPPFTKGRHGLPCSDFEIYRLH